MQPTVGRIVHYTLSAQDAERINRRRTTSKAIADRIADEKWPVGAQARIGNSAQASQVVPMIVVVAWPDEYGAGSWGVNGQAFLDGNDTLWVTSAKEGTTPGTWSWPPRLP